MPVLGSSISGNAGAAGVTVTLSGAASATTTSAADGTYSFGSLSAGSYVITPTLAGVTFTPSHQNETIVATSITGVNFVAATTDFVRTQTVTDNFHRADSPNLGANWTVTTDSDVAIAILSDVAVPQPDPLSGTEIYTGVIFSNDQYASVTLNSFATISDISIAVRNDVTNATGYTTELNGDGLGGYTVILLDWTTGNPIGVTFTLSVPPVMGDVLSIQAVGTLITVFYNGVPIISGTNSATASGAPVLGLAGTAIQTDTSASLFSAGSVAAGGSGGSGTGNTKVIEAGSLFGVGDVTQVKSPRTSIMGTNLGTKVIG